jgi:hypothetical protein
MKAVVVAVVLVEEALTLLHQLRPLRQMNITRFLATVVQDWHLVSAEPHVGMQVAVVEHLDDQRAHCQTMQVVWAVQVAVGMVGKLQKSVK